MPGGEETANSRLVVHRHMQIPAGDADVAVPSRISVLGQRPSAGQSVADECVAAVMNRQRFEAGRRQEFCTPCGTAFAR